MSKTNDEVMMTTPQAISFPIESISQLKIILTSWYSFLKGEADNMSPEEFSELLKTPIMYNLSEDKVELLFVGSSDLLESFKNKFSQS